MMIPVSDCAKELPPFLLPSAAYALEEAKARQLVPEAIDLSAIDAQTFAAIVGCDECIALYLQVKDGKVTAAHISRP